MNTENFNTYILCLNFKGQCGLKVNYQYHTLGLQ